MPLDALTGPYGDLVSRYGFIPANHSHPELFGSVARKCYDEEGVELEGYYRIVREDNGKLLNVVTDSYAFVDNRVIFPQFEEAIAKSNLDTEGMLVATDYANDGRRVFRQYLFPAHQVEVKRGVEVALRIIMLNSYDKSTSFTGRAGAYNFVCANTTIIGSDIGNFTMRHTGVLDTEKAITGLVEAAETHVKETQRMKQWPRIAVDDTAAREILCDIETSDAQIDRLVHSWVAAKDEDGPQGGENLWTLYSVLTAWATHGDKALGAMAGVEARRGALAWGNRLGRERKVDALINAPAWKALEETA